jgi:predicted LPLAT superfamily acyltransferase
VVAPLVAAARRPGRQDRFAVLAPLAAVLLFLAPSFRRSGTCGWRRSTANRRPCKRDVEYAQQRLRLRLLERQEQLMRIARDASNKEIDTDEFMGRAESLVSQYPELQA